MLSAFVEDLHPRHSPRDASVSQKIDEVYPRHLYHPITVRENGHKHFEETCVVSGVVNCSGTMLETGDYIRVNDDEKHSVTAIEDTKLLVVVHQGVVVDGMTD